MKRKLHGSMILVTGLTIVLAIGTLRAEIVEHWKLDDVRWYDKALSSTEVTELYNGQAPPDTFPPSPDPAVWVSKPRGSGDDSVGMTAKTALDRNPHVEYPLLVHRNPTGAILQHADSIC